MGLISTINTVFAMVIEFPKVLILYMFLEGIVVDTFKGTTFPYAMPIVNSLPFMPPIYMVLQLCLALLLDPTMTG